jgi:glycosyltransferase involved in cell wall biosynthesis
MIVMSTQVAVELSVVIPCLDEADTLGTCIRKALEGIREAKVTGEVIVADNGSTDGSQIIAVREGARLVPIAAKGYGSALMGGIVAADGRWIIMGDADDSYDFREIPKFITKLREGYELVHWCRLPSGGGTEAEGAMPWSHRWIGNPLFSALAAVWFHAPIHDIYCGLRGFRKDLYDHLDQRCTGMEFATEMIIKSCMNGTRIGEVPITLHKDGRVAHAPHLRTVRDGWRTLRFFLLCAPKWLFMLPGIALLVIGALAWALALPGVKIAGVSLGAHTLLVGSMAIICGFLAVCLGVLTEWFAVSEGILPAHKREKRRVEGLLQLEPGLVLSSAFFAFGLLLIAIIFFGWARDGFGPLDYAQTMRLVVPGVTACVLGVQLFFVVFLGSVLSLGRNRSGR